MTDVPGSGGSACGSRWLVQEQAPRTAALILPDSAVVGARLGPALWWRTAARSCSLRRGGRRPAGRRGRLGSVRGPEPAAIAARVTPTQPEPRARCGGCNPRSCGRRSTSPCACSRTAVFGAAQRERAGAGPQDPGAPAEWRRGRIDRCLRAGLWRVRGWHRVNATSRIGIGCAHSRRSARIARRRRRVKAGRRGVRSGCGGERGETLRLHSVRAPAGSRSPGRLPIPIRRRCSRAGAGHRDHRARHPSGRYPRARVRDLPGKDIAALRLGLLRGPAGLAVRLSRPAAIGWLLSVAEQ
jgi:hypothetical protein